MYENISMTSPRQMQQTPHTNDTKDLKHDNSHNKSDKIQISSYNEMSEKYKEQLEKNQNLEKQLLKNKIQMKGLEEKLNAKLEKDYSVCLLLN